MLPPRPTSAQRPHILRELALITVLYGLYRFGRLLANGNVAEAFANATRVWDWERSLRLPDEAALQALILQDIAWMKAVNVFYTAVHFPATIAFLIWMFRRHPGHYVWVRRTLTLLTGAGMLLHLAFPLAPPRMVPSFGLVDTGKVFGPSPYGDVDTGGLANQFAAMPSLHVGWALVVAVGLIAVGRGRRRWLWLAHPALTGFVVVVTANHYWLDGIIVTLLLAAILLLLRGPGGGPRGASRAREHEGSVSAVPEAAGTFRRSTGTG
ncbi:phosphatase PAP2 family protein [Actinocorallia sp. API 0066]|uniref:phosphatase PAP2 family protein n=1 Tax=Actinocorallia sp. API 0066 TaxID=2896846 RepID=UPI001E3ED85E|nr:phosphatase PAP2 family protein [Actinocorallia sp. API 0066]MCD0449764.1 phosphatase PAP2 family protein [Actinocorallia sp. API 0066]